MFPVLQLGPLAINTPGLILLLGLWFGLLLSEKKALTRGFEANIVYTLTAILLVAGLIGGRVVYVLEHWQAFQPDLRSVLSLDYKLLDPIGGVFIGLVLLLIYIQRNKIKVSKLLDIFVPALAIINLAKSISNLVSGVGFGFPSQLPWAIELFGVRRHPVQVYEAISIKIILLLISLLDKRFRVYLPDGSLFLVFIALSSFIRLLLETFRAESALLFGNIRAIQVFAWLVLAVCLWILGNQIKISNRKKLLESEE